MKIDLNKEDLIRLVCGTDPSHKQMKNKTVDYCGKYSGSYGTWWWDKDKLSEYSEEDIYKLYVYLINQKVCK